MTAQDVHVIVAHSATPTSSPSNERRPHTVRYIATPYSHPDTEIRQWRADAAGAVVARLASLGILAYSPIAHTHAIAQKHELPKDFSYWQNFDHAMIDRCDIVTIVMFDSWEISHGVNAEYDLARQLGKPVEFVDPWLYNLPPSPLQDVLRLSECCAAPRQLLRYIQPTNYACPCCGRRAESGRAIYTNGTVPPHFRIDPMIAHRTLFPLFTG